MCVSVCACVCACACACTCVFHQKGPLMYMYAHEKQLPLQLCYAHLACEREEKGCRTVGTKGALRKAGC